MKKTKKKASSRTSKTASTNNLDTLHAAGLVDKERLTKGEIARIRKLPAEDVAHLVRIAGKLAADGKPIPREVMFCF